MVVVENVVDREIVIVEEVSSELCEGRALSEEVRYCFFVVPAERAFTIGCFMYVVKMFIKGAVTGDEVYRSPVIFSVVIKGFVDIVYDFLWVAA